MNKYTKFLNDLKPLNPSLIEGVSRAYAVIFEEGNGVMTLAQIKAARLAKAAEREAQKETQVPTNKPRREFRTRSKYIERLSELGYPEDVVDRAEDLIGNLRRVNEYSNKTTTEGARKAGSAEKEIYNFERNMILGLDKANEQSLDNLVKYINYVDNKWNFSEDESNNLKPMGLPEDYIEDEDEAIDEDDDIDAGY